MKPDISLGLMGCMVGDSTQIPNLDRAKSKVFRRVKAP